MYNLATLNNEQKAVKSLDKTFFNLSNLKTENDVIKTFNTSEFLGDKSNLAKAYALYMYNEQKMFKDSGCGSFSKFATDILKLSKSTANSYRKVGKYVNKDTLTDSLEKPYINVLNENNEQISIENPLSFTYTQLLIMVEKLSENTMIDLVKNGKIEPSMSVKQIKDIIAKYKDLKPLDDTEKDIENNTEKDTENDTEKDTEKATEKTEKTEEIKTFDCISKEFADWLASEFTRLKGVKFTITIDSNIKGKSTKCIILNENKKA